MPPPPEQPAGAIFDIGYRGYSGPRLGRGYALWSLYIASLRSAFGLGRGVWPKVIAFGLLGLASLPALVQVLIASVAPVEDFEFQSPASYYGTIQTVVIVFVAAIAVDLVGDDKRHHVLSLYFARPLGRDDYVLAKVGALATAVGAITIGPQALMFVGNWLGAGSATDFLRDNALDVIPIVVSGVLLAAMFAALGIVVAAYAERRAYAMPTFVGAMLISFAVIGIAVDILGDGAGRWIILASPAHVARGFTLFLFDAVPPIFPGTTPGLDASLAIAYVDLPGIVYLVAALLYTAGAGGLALRHYRKLA